MSASDNIPSPPKPKSLEVQLLEKDPHLFAGLSNTKKRKLLNSLSEIMELEIYQEVTQHSSSFSGPLPPPEVLQQYIEVNPDFAQLIMQMPIDEQKYSHQRDAEIIDKSFEAKKRGQTFAFAIAITAIVGGVACILLNHEIAGGIVSGFGLTGLVAQFLGNSEKSRKNREELNN